LDPRSGLDASKIRLVIFHNQKTNFVLPARVQVTVASTPIRKTKSIRVIRMQPAAHVKNIRSENIILDEIMTNLTYQDT